MSNLIVIHTADLHLGKNRAFPDYLEQQGFMLEGIVKQVRDTCENNPKSKVMLAVSGDVFDRNQDTKRTEFVLFLVSFVSPILDLLNRYQNLRVYLIDGNHDRQPDVTEPSVLSPLAGLFGDRIRIAVSTPQFFEDSRVLLVPYQGFTSKEFRVLCDQFKPSFVLGHECLARMQTDTGWSPPRDQDHYIEIDDILPSHPEIAGVFLGDIHRSQSLDVQKLCWYSGSPVTLDHGHKLPKGVLYHYYDYKDGGWKKHDKTDLVAIDDDRIRSHYQLGKVLTEESIPWERVYQHLTCYLSLVVTPEIYAVINEKVPGFFANQQVTFEFDRKMDKKITEDSAILQEKDISLSYYQGAIQEWSEINLVDYSADLKLAFVQRAVKNFEGRLE